MKWNGIPKNNYVFRSKIVYYSLTTMLSLIWGSLCYLLITDILSNEFGDGGGWIVYTYLTSYVAILAYIIQPTLAVKAQLKRDKKEAIAELMQAVKIKRDLRS